MVINMNKRGVTLIEVLISVGLIATVVLFLFNLLLDVQYETEHGTYAKKNQVNRITIIKTIEEDFINKGVDLKTIPRSFSTDYTLVIPFLDGTNKLLEVQENYIRYGGNKWLIAKDNDFTKYDVTNLTIVLSDENSCTPMLNVDTDNDGNCNINCDRNNNGKLDAEDTNIDENYKACGKYQSLKITIPVETRIGTKNIIDDIELFYIGKL